MLWHDSPPVRRQVVSFLLFTAAACGSSSTEPPPPPPGVQLIAGGGQDTIEALFAQGVVVEVRTSAGPASNASVRFESVPGSTGAMVLLASTSSPFGTSAGVTTDPRGRAVALVRNGLTAGTGSVRILVPEFGFETQVSYTILPGGPASLFVRDTTIDIAERITPLGVVRDRARNEVSIPPGSLTFTGGSPQVLAEGGAIEGADVGIGRVVATFSGVDTAFNTRVVPPGRVGMANFVRNWAVLVILPT